MKKVLGIDEAGRGAVLGPLIICGYLIDETKLDAIKTIGRDSKTLSPKQRELRAIKLRQLADDYVLLRLSAMDIDKLRTESNLNKIEIGKMQQLINGFKPDKVIIDSIEANCEKFKQKIIKGLDAELIAKAHSGELEVVCENFADKKYPIVGAASILAKVQRDAEIHKLQEKYHNYEMGSGYPSDPRTISFLKAWLEKHKQFPYFVRRSWITATQIKKKEKQKGIREFVR
jgi:ribonuclease HII